MSVKTWSTMRHTWKGVEVLARRLLGWPDGVLGSMESLDVKFGDDIDGVRVQMAEQQPPPFTKGPREGKPNWTKVNGAKRLYPIDVLDREAQAWEAETGNCYACLGDGQVMQSWSVKDGLKTKPCPDCGGTGKKEQP